MTATKTPTCLCGERLRRLILDTEGTYKRPYLIYRCERCDLLSVDPMPTTEEALAQYQAYGSYADPDYHRADIERKRSQAKRLVKRIERLLGKRMVDVRFLEVGCAAGALLVGLQELGADVHGVEVDVQNAELARTRLGDRVHVGTLESSKHGPGSFDVVYAEQVIEHVVGADRFLKECMRVLRPGGLLIAGTPNFDGLAARTLMLGWKEFAPWEHVRMFTPDSLRFYLREAGFTRPKVKTQGIWFIRNRDRKDLIPLKSGGVARRALSKAVELAGVGDGLLATAFKPVAARS